MSYNGRYLKEHRDQAAYERLKKQVEHRKEMAKINPATQVHLNQVNMHGLPCDDPMLYRRDDRQDGP
jgi:hypothetical protein